MYISAYCTHTHSHIHKHVYKERLRGIAFYRVSSHASVFYRIFFFGSHNALCVICVCDTSLFYRKERKKAITVVIRNRRDTQHDRLSARRCYAVSGPARAAGSNLYICVYAYLARDKRCYYIIFPINVHEAMWSM